MNISRALRLVDWPETPHVISFVGAGGKSSALFQLAQELATLKMRVVCATTTRLAASQIGQSPAALHIKGDSLPLAEIARLLDEHGQCLLLGQPHAPRGQVDKLAGVMPQAIDHLVDHASDLNIAAVLIEADGSRMLPVKAPADHEPVLPQRTTILVPVLGLDALGAPLASDRVHRPERIRRILSLPETATTARLTPELAARLLVDRQGGAKGRPAQAQFIPLLNKADTASRLAGGRLMARWLNRRGCPALISTLHSPTLGPVRERWAPITIIILAAGGSTRMGQAKQLMALDGESMLQRSVTVALDSDADQVLVVTGAYHAEVEEALRSLAADHGPRLAWTHNQAWQSGQASSVRVGISRLENNVDAAILMPVDQPLLPATLLRRLVQRWQQGAEIVAPRVDGEIRGAPALFDRAYWPELSKLNGDVGGRTLLRRYASRVACVDVSPTTVRDVDTPGDLEGLFGA